MFHSLIRPIHDYSGFSDYEWVIMDIKKGQFPDYTDTGTHIHEGQDQYLNLKAVFNLDAIVYIVYHYKFELF